MTERIAKFIKAKRSEGHGWDDIKSYVRTTFYIDYSSAEALRSAYRRYRNKHSEVAIERTVADAFSGASEALSAFGATFARDMADRTVEELTELPSAGKQSLLPQEHSSQGLTAPLAIPPAFELARTLDHKPTLIIADLHCPYHSLTAIDSALDTAYGKCEQTIIAGDVFDFASVSRHSKAEIQARLETELEIAGRVLLHIAERAPVYICNGNHDQRLASKLDVELRLSRVINMALNGRIPKHPIVVTEYDYLFVGSEYVVGHLSNYSQTPGKIAAELAKKYQRHAFVGHDHIVGFERAGTYIGASIGAMTYGDSHWYNTRRLNTFPQWQQGFAIIHKNGFQLYRNDELYYDRLVIDGALWEHIRV